MRTLKIVLSGRLWPNKARDNKARDIFDLRLECLWLLQFLFVVRNDHHIAFSFQVVTHDARPAAITVRNHEKKALVAVFFYSHSAAFDSHSAADSTAAQSAGWDSSD